jgi:hypothetical protein
MIGNAVVDTGTGQTWQFVRCVEERRMNPYRLIIEKGEKMATEINEAASDWYGKSRGSATM